MGYYDYLCDLLEPLRIYATGRGTLSGAELYAAGEALDRAEAALAHAGRESVLETAEEEGLIQRERLFARCPVSPTPELRREAVTALCRIGAGDFTLADINHAISGCGIYARAVETDRYGVIEISFPHTAGEPEGFEQIRKIILDIIPCHLETYFRFRYLTWAECEAAGWTWGLLNEGSHTWDSFTKAVPDE